MDRPLVSQDPSEQAELLALAEREFEAGNLDRAKLLYLRVIEGTDDSEARDFLSDGYLCVRLLTSDDFVNYVHVMRQNGRVEDILWVPSVRGMALWRLGYICAEREELQEAITYLETAHRVLPRSATVATELAYCHGILGSHDVALALYQSIGDVGYHVTARGKAVSLRGAGAQLTELGRFVEALDAYSESLRYEKSRLALNEIAYVRRLMAGAAAVGGEPIRSTSGAPCCCECDAVISDGFSGMRGGRVVYLCVDCERRTRPKWWQFWRRRLPLLPVQFISDQAPPAPN